jgi:uncharacterized membrane protein
MWSWFTFWLLLHIMTAIAAFGPNYAFPLIARFAQKDPRNALVVSEIMHAIESKITIPAAVLMPFLGLALIYTGHIDLWQSEWLVIAIVLYIVTFFFALLVQLPNTVKMIDLLKAMPPPGPAAPGGQEPRPTAVAPGPPPEVAALGRKLQMGGMLLTVLLTAIIVLMVWKPGIAFTG